MAGARGRGAPPPTTIPPTLFFPRGVVVACELPVWRPTRVIHKHIQQPEALHCTRHQKLSSPSILHIASQGQHLNARLTRYFVCGCLEYVFTPSAPRQVSPFTRQAKRDCFANPLARSRDEGHAALQTHVHYVSSC